MLCESVAARSVVQRSGLGKVKAHVWLQGVVKGRAIGVCSMWSIMNNIVLGTQVLPQTILRGLRAGCGSVVPAEQMMDDALDHDEESCGRESNVCHAGGEHPRSGRNTCRTGDRICAAFLQRVLSRVEQRRVDVWWFFFFFFSKFCSHCTMLSMPFLIDPACFLKSVSSSGRIVASCSEPTPVPSSALPLKR